MRQLVSASCGLGRWGLPTRFIFAVLWLLRGRTWSMASCCCLSKVAPLSDARALIWYWSKSRATRGSLKCQNLGTGSFLAFYRLCCATEQSLWQICAGWPWESMHPHPRLPRWWKFSCVSGDVLLLSEPFQLSSLPLKWKDHKFPENPVIFFLRINGQLWAWNFNQTFFF